MPIDPTEFGGGPPAIATPNVTGVWDGVPLTLEVFTDNSVGSAVSFVVTPTNSIVMSWVALYAAGDAASVKDKVFAGLTVQNKDGTPAKTTSTETPIDGSLNLIVSADKKKLGISIPDGFGLSDAGGYNVTVWIIKTVSGVLLDQWTLTAKLIINIAGAPQSS